MSENDKSVNPEAKITIRPEDLAVIPSPNSRPFGASAATTHLSIQLPVAPQPSQRNLISFAVAGVVAVVVVVGIAIAVSLREGAPPADATSSSERTKTAILRILKADSETARETTNRALADPNSTPSILTRAIGQYCSTAEALDLSDCPADFRVAYKQHLRAWREAQGVVSNLPDGLMEGLLMGAINAVTRGEVDGGTRRLEEGVRTIFERIRTTWEEVEKIGAKYGAAL